MPPRLFCSGKQFQTEFCSIVHIYAIAQCLHGQEKASAFKKQFWASGLAKLFQQQNNIKEREFLQNSATKDPGIQTQHGTTPLSKSSIQSLKEFSLKLGTRKYLIGLETGLN